ncbi:MAG: hypothetical protein IKC41_04325 [Clostridia bacterium]|nr:hypothetical protein [Clostridia bacterium]MBR2973424.1 hypothetical protein [Clostridia bacterium]MBR3576795.1 hypothetical protein [Clostridia bacterium]
MAVETVLGKVEKKDLGIITPHEHTFIDLRGFYTDRPVRGCDDPYNAPVTMDKLGILSRDPYALRDNLLMDDYDTQCDEIMQFKNAGGRTVVDATTTGIGKDPERLKKLALDTGLHIIAGAGYYVGSMLPPELDTMSAEEIAETIIEEIEVGINGTDIKAGVIGEIGIGEDFSEMEEKILRAACIAQIKTGLGLLIHINPWVPLGVRAAKIALEMGVPKEKICICHVDVECRMDYMKEVLDLGVYIEYDNFGKEYFVNQEVRNKGYGNFVTDVYRVETLKELIDAGYADQIVLSCDVCLKNLLHKYGGWGFDHILVNIVPMMKEYGISQADIDKMLITNPADFLD